MNRRAAVLVMVLTSSCATTPPPLGLTPGPVATPELYEQIARADTILFDAVFNTCNADAVGESVTEDFEFYHDKGGLTASSREQFVDAIRKLCERQAQGVDFRARRELDRASLRVYPLNNYGAVETGTHRFYAVVPGQPDKLTESAQFTHIWKNDNGVWRVARVLSYDHQLASEP